MKNTTALYRILSQIPNLNKQKILKLSRTKCKHHHSLIEHTNCLKQYLNLPEERIGFFDIETTNLNANWGVVLSYCIKEQNKDNILYKTITKKDIDNGKWDYNVIKQLCEDLKKFDRIIGYYSSRFDNSFVRTKAVKWNLEFPYFKELYHTDLYYIIRNKFAFHSNRLKVACDYFNIPSKEHDIKPEIFLNAITGKKSAIDYVLQHNKEDVISTELLYNKIMNYSGISKTSI